MCPLEKYIIYIVYNFIKSLIEQSVRNKTSRSLHCNLTNVVHCLLTALLPSEVGFSYLLFDTLGYILKHGVTTTRLKVKLPWIAYAIFVDITFKQFT